MASPVVLLVLCAIVGLSSSKTGVCYQKISSTEYYHVYVTHKIYMSCNCGLFGRCHKIGYTIWMENHTRAVYHTEFGCCNGYQQNGAQKECFPICSACDNNHTCIAPDTCGCPVGWTGKDCSEDINECHTSRPCEQNCNNNIGSYSCSCDEGYSLAADIHSCLGSPRYANIDIKNATSLLVYWIAPELDSWDGDIVDYQISCSSTFGFNHTGVVPAGTTDYRLNWLRPFSNYICCILANTTNGPSSSSCATGETKQDRPDDFPNNIRVQTGSAFALFIEWDPPLLPNGLITNYTIYVTYDNGLQTFLSVNGSKQSYLLDALSPYQNITIAMSASTVAGEGPTSENMAFRTSQAVPSAVTGLEVYPLPPNALQISWTLPEFPNGVLTHYEITVYNKVFGYNSSVCVAADVHRVNISEDIEPSIPYTVEIRAFTCVGGGVPETKTMFSQEVVPKSNPTISALNRTNAMTAQLRWEFLSLEELGGFLTSYIVKYNEKVAHECPDTPPDTSKMLFTEGDNVPITDLYPSMEYCVGVAASTAKGVGRYSLGHIPLYTNIIFQIYLHKVHKCLKWTEHRTQAKISELTDEITSKLSIFCGFYIPATFIADGVLSCHDGSSSKVIFEGKIILPEGRNASEVKTQFIKWVSTNPQLNILGVQLEIDEMCHIDDEECLTTYNPNASSPMNVILGVTLGVGIPCIIVIIVVVWKHRCCNRNDPQRRRLLEHGGQGRGYLEGQRQDGGQEVGPGQGDGHVGEGQGHGNDGGPFD